ncbi:MAG: phenylalanine--tRNA ligase subunit beta, partial [Kiritimatiellae bacterium]|nr:phenylalanine--tRNA ligase subunit beta [Kiritimatiellia bacterium]
MKVPVSWLSEYVDLTGLSVRDLVDKLTFSGIEVEGVEQSGAVLDDHFVVGEVLTCVAHPNSDHLHICKVSDGTQEWQVVCGAPNCAAGIKAPLARLGAEVPEGGFTIKAAKLRGVPSQGMLCSARELKLSADHEGIMILDAALKAGTPLRYVLPPPETILDLEITWNRPDCLSIVGIAREFAALLRRPLKLPSVDFPVAGEPAEHLAAVRVEAPDLCPRYTARVLTEVHDGTSPAWMQRRLEQCGVRPLGLIVDVTNYVMLECGQPLHAFDHTRLADRTIVVRKARPGEKLRTLDGAERALDEQMLVIADVREAVAVAGVMGGAGSEIAPGTSTVLMESALFAAPSIKRTATALGMRTEASYRFERGMDRDVADWASRRAVSLLAQYAGARVAPGVIDADYRPAAPAPVALRQRRLREVIGLPLDATVVRDILTALGLRVTKADEGETAFQIPSWRGDLVCEADLIEEVARIHGLAQLPDVTPTAIAVPGADDAQTRSEALCRQTLLGFGLTEAMHYSFLSAAELD